MAPRQRPRVPVGRPRRSLRAPTRFSRRALKVPLALPVGPGEVPLGIPLGACRLPVGPPTRGCSVRPGGRGANRGARSRARLGRLRAASCPTAVSATRAGARARRARHARSPTGRAAHPPACPGRDVGQRSTVASAKEEMRDRRGAVGGPEALPHPVREGVREEATGALTDRQHSCSARRGGAPRDGPPGAPVSPPARVRAALPTQTRPCPASAVKPRGRHAGHRSLHASLHHPARTPADLLQKCLWYAVSTASPGVPPSVWARPDSYSARTPAGEACTAG